MVSICFYFQVHQPFRLRNYGIFEIGNSKEYFDREKNSEIMRKVARKCYLPANEVILELLEKHPEFKVTFSISGVCLEQMQIYAPQVIQSFRQLAATGRVEFLAETYYHSLAFLYDKAEFDEQVRQHSQVIERFFGQRPKAFRNTELIYNNELAKHVESLGFSSILAEGWDPVLGWRSPNFIYESEGTQGIKLLLKNYRLSDDVAFRFSNREWASWPLTVEKYSDWIDSVNGSGDVVNLFMDYETFGEHQWEDTGIFSFFRDLPQEMLKNADNRFVTVSEAATIHQSQGVVDIGQFISWADMERDLSAWLGNGMQKSAIEELYRIGTAVKETGDGALLESWRKLTTSDHFYYMCVKWFADGDVHKYFSPYESPYEAYIAFMNVLNDLAIRAKVKIAKNSPSGLVMNRPSERVFREPERLMPDGGL